MRKRYAVFMAAITFDNQRKILEGIRKRAEETGSDIFVFSCHVNWSENAEVKRGAFQIMTLPDIKNFDGVIFVKNTIHDSDIADELIQKVKESKIPAVSIDEKISGFYNVGISNYEAEQMVVKHLIQKHGIRKLNYVTGPMSNREANERWKGFRDILTRHGIPYEEDRVFSGDFTAESGEKAIEEFLKRDPKLPEAIVFANDNMAIGGMQALSDRGYKVPEDVLIAGFDDDNLAWANIPSLTTVSRYQEEMGYVSLMTLDRGQNNPTDCRIDTSLALRESCSCAKFNDPLVAKLRKNYCRLTTDIQRSAETIKSMAMGLAGLESPTELYEKLKEYIRATDMKQFYLCMCDEEMIPKYSYTEKVNVPIAYQDGVFCSYDDVLASSVLPESLYTNNDPSCYVVFPVAYRDLCFGYCVMEGSRQVFESELIYSWAVNIGIALENIRKWMLLDQMNKK